jgi:hypothetical protein
MSGTGKRQAVAGSFFRAADVSDVQHQNLKGVRFMACCSGAKKRFRGLQIRLVQLVRIYTVCYMASRIAENAMTVLGKLRIHRAMT